MKTIKGIFPLKWEPFYITSGLFCIGTRKEIMFIFREKEGHFRKCSYYYSEKLKIIDYGLDDHGSPPIAFDVETLEEAKEIIYED